jgi:hypothetical protein
MNKLNSALINVQSQLKAPKSQYNSFGKYAYRNAEDILEAVKPLLAENGLTMTISDEVISNFPDSSTLIIKATATVSDGESSLSVSACAGIDPNRKGMDIAQSFGSSSSYARKYAMSGLLLIDDTKDADSTNTHGKDVQTTKAVPSAPAQDTFQQAIDFLKSSSDKAKAYDAIIAKYGTGFSEAQVNALKKFVK